MPIFHYKIYYWVLLILLFGCRERRQASEIRTEYRFDQPAANIPLPSSLKEVSGLTFISDSMVVVVQDEDGILYKFNLSNQSVVDEVRFAGKGDYEGVAYLRDTFFVLKSNGNIISVAVDGTSKVHTRETKTFLSKTNNAEGIALSPDNQMLWIACKGFPGDHDSLKGTKAVYEFDPGRRQLAPSPVLTVDLDSIRDRISAGSVKRGYERFSEFIDPEGGNITFQPSGIAVHPVNGHIYIISSVGKLIIKVASDGHLIDVNHLTHPSFKQPEGIGFFENGNMMIANEGKGGKANLLVFTYQPE